MTAKLRVRNLTMSVEGFVAGEAGRAVVGWLEVGLEQG